MPGASAAVVFADGRVWSGAAGVAVLKPARPMTSRTSLPFASITKIATAALAMRLVEQGKLGLDDPIVRWYPAWRGDRRASVRDLLGHTAGIGDPPDTFFGRFARDEAPTPRQYTAATPKPGPTTTDAVYSNSGFMIAGIILARAAGEPVADAMRREIFGALGGDGLAYQPAERPHPPLAHSYWYPERALDPGRRERWQRTDPVARRRGRSRRPRARSPAMSRRWPDGRTLSSTERSSTATHCTR